ncbi:MAG: GNAT family N-acetyltransferase [Planctomycetota bacterium]|nr:GNAT family N-acetyltransferase [Planctomycetota bacterium]
MNFEWIHENPSYWDASKQRIIGGAPDGIFRMDNVREGEVLPGEWWHVERDGKVVGYGWMDQTWGDAEILLAVDEGSRGQGVGTFILDGLEREARSHGLNYLYNVVRETHPDREGISAWLKARRFDAPHGDEGLLKRAIPHV